MLTGWALPGDEIHEVNVFASLRQFDLEDVTTTWALKWSLHLRCGCESFVCLIWHKNSSLMKFLVVKKVDVYSIPGNCTEL